MLGLGADLVYSASPSEYVMTKSILFDGTNDNFLTNTLSGTAPANGSTKPTTNSLSVAVWLKFEDGTSDPYNNGTAALHAINCLSNGGWGISYTNKQLRGRVNFTHPDGSTFSHTVASKFGRLRPPTSGVFNKVLHKPDNWHFVVMTNDMSDGTNQVVTNLYVDGNRAQAGNESGSGTTNQGAQDETSETKKTTSASGTGNIVYRYNPTGDQDELDLSIGSQGGFTDATNVTAGSTAFWLGYIGDAAVWENVVLSQSEIATLYNLHRPIDMSTTQSSFLRGYWRPTLGLNDHVTGITGTLVDDAAIVSHVPTTDVSGFFGYQ